MTYYQNFSLKLRYAMIPVMLLLTMYPSEPPAPCSGQANPYLLQNLQSPEFSLPRYNSEDVWGKTGAKEGAWVKAKVAPYTVRIAAVDLEALRGALARAGFQLG